MERHKETIQIILKRLVTTHHHSLIYVALLKQTCKRGNVWVWCIVAYSFVYTALA